MHGASSELRSLIAGQVCKGRALPAELFAHALIVADLASPVNLRVLHLHGMRLNLMPGPDQAEAGEAAGPRPTDSHLLRSGASVQDPAGHQRWHGEPHERAEGLRACSTKAPVPGRALDSIMAVATISYDRRRAG
jgi:hypothetical protein